MKPATTAFKTKRPKSFLIPHAGKALKAARERQGMRMTDVSKALGVNPGYVARWEDSKTVKSNVCIKYARAVRCSLEELLGITTPHVNGMVPKGKLFRALARASSVLGQQQQYSLAWMIENLCDGVEAAKKAASRSGAGPSQGPAASNPTDTPTPQGLASDSPLAGQANLPTGPVPTP